MIQEILPDKSKELFNYCLATSVNTPYYYPVNFEHWQKSMFSDCDYDGHPLFSELKTFAFVNNGAIKGYIQWGLSSFSFNENGEKDYGAKYGVIRALHYMQNTKCETALLNKATEYFDMNNVKKRHAFFHYLGMSCYARQGKLHESGFYMEELLRAYSFQKEHENVYFSRCLTENLPADIPGITFAYSGDQQSVKFSRDGEEIGGCELYFVPGSKVCFLKLICIHQSLSRQGLGTKCMYKLFSDLRQKGYVRIDTDTTDSNVHAQKYYEKTGFINRGIMRSYCTD